MISIFRKHLGRKFLLIIIWLTLFSFVGIGVISFLYQKFGDKRGLSGSVGEVNGYKITPLEYQRKLASLEQYQHALRQQFGKSAGAIIEALGLQNPADSAMREILTQKLLRSAADKMHLDISEEYLCNKLANPQFALQLVRDWVPGSLINQNGIRYQDLLKVLQRQGVSPTALEDIIEERIKGSMVMAIVQNAAHVPEAVVADTINREERSKKFSIIKISVNPYVKEASAHKASPEALRHFFAEANERNHYYWTQERRTGKVYHFDHVDSTSFASEAKQAIDQGSVALDSFIKKHKGQGTTIKATPLTKDIVIRKLFMLSPGSSDVLMRGNDKADIVELISIEPSVEQSYESVKAQVEKDYYRSQAAEKISSELEDLKSLSGDKRKHWIASHHALVETTGFLSPDKRAEWKIDEPLRNQRFMSMSRIGEVMTILTPDYGYFIELTDFGPLDEAKVAARRKAVLSKLSQEEGTRVGAGFVASLEKSAKIKTNKSFLH